MLALEWASLLPATEALPWLERVHATTLASGADGTARSLATCIVDGLLERDPAAAATRAASLRHELPLGLHGVSYPPQAWWTLARALHPRDPAAAEACRAEAVRWIDSAVMPDPDPATVQRFRHGNPVNRAVLAGWGDGTA